MERISKPMNGAAAGHLAPDSRSAFSLVDPATGKRRAVREMTDAELERHLDGVTERVVSTMNVAMGQFAQVLAQPPDPRAGQCLSTMEEARQATGFLMVLQYELNRRANVGALVLASA